MTDLLRQCEAVLFDFDGTLADSYSAIAASVNHVRALRGLPAIALDEVKRNVGRGADYLLTHTVPGGDLTQDLACYRAHHPSVMTTHTHLLPGARELITSLHRAGKKLGLCSNKPRLFSEGILKHLEIAPYFSVVLGPEDVALPKPAPDMLCLALERLHVHRVNALYVGDMTVDIQTARAAGVCVWIVPTGSDERAVLEAERPDRLLGGLPEMVAEVGGM